MEKEEKRNQIIINGDGNRLGDISQSIGGSAGSGETAGGGYDKAEIRRWISNGELKKALLFLQENEQRGAAVELVPLLLQRLHDVEDRERKGVIGREDYSIEKNRITHATLQLVALLP